MGCPRRGEGTHKGCPYGWIGGGPRRGEGTHKGCPYGWIGGGPRRGEGTHKGCPYGWIGGACEGGGRPQGVPLRLGRGCPRGGRAPTRGAPTGWIGGAREGGGHPQGVTPTGWMRRAREGGGHPRGARLRLDDVGAHTGGRAPTRGAPTRFRQPQVGLSQFDAISLGRTTRIREKGLGEARQAADRGRGAVERCGRDARSPRMQPCGPIEFAG